MVMALRKVYYQDEHTVLSTESDGSDIHLHLEAKDWTHKDLRNTYNVFVRLEEDCRKAGYSRMITYTPNPKFAHLFGGKTIGYTEYQEKPIEVVIWELKHS